jgi:APA family basic amino acid/polyamine antiporter
MLYIRYVSNPVTQKIGLWTTIALVVGNMIASGIFMLPAALAKFGPISLLGWIASSIGAIVLALMFSNLSKRFGQNTGGPYTFTRAGLGEFPAFLVAWGYWLANCITVAAITVTFISYLSVFVPLLRDNSVASITTGLSVIWLLTGINALGVRSAGKLQVATTLLKLAPLLAVTIAGIFFIDTGNYVPFNLSGMTDFQAITATTTLTLFAFVGLESATVPSGNISDPEKNIPKATLIGSLITIVIYVTSSFVILGMIPSAQLQNSAAPFADAATLLWGTPGRYAVAIGAIISTFGALNGWILLQGQIPFAAARDKMLPAMFGYQNENGVPIGGMISSSVLVSAIMIMNFTKGLSGAFYFLVLLSTVIVLVPYIFSASSFGIIVLREEASTSRKTHLAIALLAFIYSMWAIIGSGKEAVYYGFICLLAGVPLYVWMKRS